MPNFDNDSPVPRPLVLWSPPRVVSTAFLRMMHERGDFVTMLEPYMRPFYIGPQRGCDRFSGRADILDDTWTYDKVTRDIADAAVAAARSDGNRRRVFVKDMAYYMPHVLSPSLLGRYESTALLRHPAFVLPSLGALMPDYADIETGFEGLRDVVRLATDMADGTPPPVVDSEELLADPAGMTKAYCAAVGIPFLKHALQWKKAPCAALDISMFEEFMGGVRASDGLKQRDRRTLPTLDEHTARQVDALKGFYEEVAVHKLAPLAA